MTLHCMIFFAPFMGAIFTIDGALLCAGLDSQGAGNILARSSIPYDLSFSMLCLLHVFGDFGGS